MSSSSLAPYLITLRRRLRLRDGWLLTQRTFWMSLVVMIGILGIGRLVPIRGLILWVIFPFCVWLCAVLSYSLLRLRPLPDIALEVDLELGFKERLSTAIELETQIAQPQISQLADLPTLQQTDALKTVQAVNPSNAFPFYWLHRPMLTTAVLLLIALVLIYLPNPMDALLAERAAIEQAAQEQAQIIKELNDEIELNSKLSPEMQAELLHQLEELTQQLRDNPGDREKALADLSKMEEELRRQLDSNTDLRQASLDAIASQLQSLIQQENANTPTPTEALEQFTSVLANMSDTERRDLAEALAQMAAQAAQSGDQSLAQALASLSHASLSGDSDAAMQAASELAEAMEQAQSDLAVQSTLQQTLDQLQNSSQAIAQAGGSGYQTASQDSIKSSGSGQGQTPGQGNQPGQGQSGQGQSGGGTKADTLPPGTGSGNTEKPNNIDTGVESAELGEQIFIPWERRATEGPEVSISGQDTGQGETITREKPNPSAGMPGSALIPYQYVYTQYFDAAQQAISRSQIPPTYRDLVRDYFSQLEP